MSSRSVMWFPPGVDVIDEPHLGIQLAGDEAPFIEVAGGVGRFAPPWVLAFDSSPGVPGARLNMARMGQRAFSFRFLCMAEDRSALRAAIGDLVSALNPELGVGQLVVATRVGEASGVVRRISAVYNGGLEGDAWLGSGPVSAWAFTVSFLTEDPHWYTLEPVTASWVPVAGTPFFPFGFPFSLSPGGFVEEEPLTVGGDTTSWPVWTLTAPFARMRLTLDRTGEWVEVRRDAADAGVSAVLTTQPGRRAVRTPEGMNIFEQRFGTPFGLREGDTVSVDVDGQGADTAVSVAFDEAWLSEP